MATLVSAAMMMTLGGCSSGPEGGLTLLGDSITVLSGEATTERLASTMKTRVVADWGLRIDQQLENADKIAKRKPDQVIINLGTNNILQGRSTDSSIADYRQLLDRFDHLHCVAVVTLNEHIDRMGVDLTAPAQQFNDRLRTLAAEYPNTRVIEWSSMFVYPQDEGLLDSDTVHPNEQGIERIAAANELTARACEIPKDEES